MVTGWVWLGVVGWSVRRLAHTILYGWTHRRFHDRGRCQNGYWMSMHSEVQLQNVRRDTTYLQRKEGNRNTPSINGRNFHNTTPIHPDSPIASHRTHLNSLRRKKRFTSGSHAILSLKSNPIPIPYLHLPDHAVRVPEHRTKTHPCKPRLVSTPAMKNLRC